MLRSIIFPLILTVFLSSLAIAQSLHLSGDNIRAHVKYLASDELEGRGVGTRGEKLATEYLAAQLALNGVKPGGENGTYFQRVPLVGVRTLPSATVAIESHGRKIPLRFVKDFVGTAYSQVPKNDFNAEAIFVGHGISAPEFGWDDYKGVDLRGKVAVFFTNEPPSTDPKFFGGAALTYYGRWTYKFEEANRRGAVAAIIIHTTQTAGYGWGVLSGSFSQEHPEMKLEPGEHGLKLESWVTAEAGQKLVASTGKTLDQLLAIANQKSFRPIPLGVHVVAHIPVDIRQIDSRNVIGRVEGSGPDLKNQAVLFTAHWDHLGIGVPVNGDKIYNGAVDNATGCAMVLEIARLWASLPIKPKRSGLFVFVTAEEAGLLGSEYYGKHPMVAAGSTAADLNFDAFTSFGKTRDVSVTGAERTTLWPLVERDATRMNLSIAPDAEPGQGHYYRSDHFSLARIGIPSFSISAGHKYLGKPDSYGQAVFEEYNSKHYHQPSDEYHDDWNVGGMVQMAEFGLNLGLDIANTPRLATWNAGDEFLAARQRSGVR
ncbi:MAG TPA: M28 family peptidase [Bryobacteraceae bacterium]|nr:M28 family peptidase [Bryobacteraceae bacterium]